MNVITITENDLPENFNWREFQAAVIQQYPKTAVRFLVGSKDERRPLDSKLVIKTTAEEQAVRNFVSNFNSTKTEQETLDDEVFERIVSSPGFKKLWQRIQQKLTQVDARLDALERK